MPPDDRETITIRLRREPLDSFAVANHTTLSKAIRALLGAALATPAAAQMAARTLSGGSL